MSAAFGDAELAMLWQIELDLPPEDRPSGASTKAISFATIEYCRQRGCLPELEAAVLKLRPKNHEVKKYHETYAAKEVVESMVGIKSDPGSRKHIRQFYRGDFRAARDLIYTLNGYKILHDNLHNLQVADLNIITDDDDLATMPEGIAKRFIKTFEDYVRDIGVGLNKLPPGDQDKERLWVKLFEEAIGQVCEALDAKDADRWRSNIAVLRSVCNRHLARIDGILLATVRLLPFDRLVAALTVIRQEPPGDPTRADHQLLHRQLERGINGLRELQRALTARLEEHNLWQQLDALLVMAAGFLTSSQANRSSFKIVWAQLKSALEDRCRCTTEKWSCELCKRTQQVKSEVEREQTQFASIRKSFDRLKIEASAVFLRVDRELRESVGKLEPIGDAVDSLLEDPVP
jgi:hypothetical protein